MEEKALFKNSSKMNENEMFVFQSYALKKTIFLSSFFLIIFCVVLGARLCFVKLFLGIAIIIAGLIGGFVLVPYILKDSIKKQNKLIFDNKKYLNHFEFYDDFLEVTNEEAATNENIYHFVIKEKFNYSDLLKVVVYGTYIFLYINKSQSLVLNQKGMTLNTSAELVSFLKSKNIKVIDKFQQLSIKEKK